MTAIRKWIASAALLLVAAPVAFADGPRGKRGYHRHHSHRQHYSRGYYRAPIIYSAPRMGWVPSRYGVIPTYYRARFQPVPVGYYGPAIAPGCRRAYVDGYVVDYRPSNFVVVQFGRAW